MDNSYCCVPQCTSHGCKTPRPSFHRFPSENENSGKRFLQWITKLRIGREVSPRMVVCGKHFKESDFFPSTAGPNGLKRRKLKRNAVPSLNLPTTPSNMDESENDLNVRTSIPACSKEISINKGITGEESKFLRLVETNSQEPIGNQEKVVNNMPLIHSIDIEKEYRNEGLFINISNVCTIAPISFDTNFSNVEDIQNCITPESDGKNKEKPGVNCSILKSSSNNSQEILKRKLNKQLSINASLPKKVKFYRRKYKMYEKEVNILKGVIENLKLINSATFGSTDEHTSVNSGEHAQNCTTATSSNEKIKEKQDFDCSMFKSSPSDSKDILKRKLKTVQSANEDMKEKIEYYRNKCTMFEKEVNIMKGVIDSLKLINSVTFDN